MYYRQPTAYDASSIARAIAIRHGIRAVETEAEWSYNLQTKVLKYARFSPWSGISYEHWYALLMHEISHILFTTDVELPKTHKRREWHLLHNFIEDNYIERRLELTYPQGHMYKKLLKQYGADAVMEWLPRLQQMVKDKKYKEYRQFLALCLVYDSGLPEDEGYVLEVVSDKVRDVWESCREFVKREDFANTNETMEYMLTNFGRYAELLEEDEDEDDMNDPISKAIRAAVGNTTESRAHAMSGLEKNDRGFDPVREGIPEPKEVYEFTPEDVEAEFAGRTIQRGVWEAGPRKPDYSQYKEYEREMRLQARTLRKNIEPFLREMRARRYERMQKSGIIDNKRIYKAAIPKNTVFKKQVEVENTEHYAITVAVDESGSMEAYRGNDPWGVALKSAIMIVEACSQMNIPTRVTRFDHANWTVTNGWSVTHEDYYKGLIASKIRGGNNNDIEALTKFVKEAKADADATGRKHIVFMIGDGLGEEEMNEEAKKLQKKHGVDIFGIIINNNDQGNESQYPHAKFVEDTEDLPMVMKSLLKQYLGKRVL